MKKYVVVGLGVQGLKRIKYLKKSNVITVDPFKKSDYNYLELVPKNLYNVVIICVPDSDKEKIIEFCIKNKKHFLIEKPFPFLKEKRIKFFSNLAKKNKVIGYIAYNHRFEPNFEELKKILLKNEIGKIYSCKLFYGNGTSQLVKKSPWRDKGLGVIGDLGSHLLDICNYWFNVKPKKFEYFNYNRFENKAPDHSKIIFRENNILFDLEMTLCMWRNHFTCDILGEKGSAHIYSLCKWDETHLIIRKRIFPSGKPKERIYKLKMDDPTWEKELIYFKKLIKNKMYQSFEKDIWINNLFKTIKRKIK